jgi:hypothetical protein
MVEFLFIWWAAIFITSFKSYGAIRILRKKDIPFESQGYSVSRKSIKKIIETHSEDKELVKKLKKALFYSNLSALLLFGWVALILIAIIL